MPDSPRNTIADTAPPVAASRPAAPPDAPGLRLEALVYADAPTERMVFINGRRVLSIASIPYDQLKGLVQFEIDHAGK